MNRRVLAMVPAGGKGTRLYPLTKNRAKPAVPFGGKYRIHEGANIGSLWEKTEAFAMCLKMEW